MTIRIRSFIVFLLLAVGFLAVVWQTSTWVLLANYVALERRTVENNLERLRRSVEQELSQMARTANDWGSWNETYDFIAGQNPSYIEENLTSTTLDSAGITLNVFQLLDLDGQVVLERGYDFQRHGWTDPIDLSAHHSGAGLLRPLGINEVLSGVVTVDAGPMLTVARHILTSSAEGPSRGRIVMGRLLNGGVIRHLSSTTRLDVAAFEWRAAGLPADVESARESLSRQTPTSVEFASEDSMHGYLLLSDIHGDPALILKTTFERTISLSGKATINSYTVHIFLGALVFLLVCVLFLDRTVLARLARLMRQVNEIRSDRSLRVDARGSDEISNLAGEMNSLLTTVEQAEADLRELNESLERRVEGRTRELADLNRQLELEIAERKAAQHEAEEQAQAADLANQAKGTFLANISHEVRTPMNAVIGYSEILRRSITDPQQRDHLDSIDSSGRALISLLESILDFSRLQSGDLVLNASPMETRGVIADLDGAFASAAQEGGLSYSSSIDDNVPAVVLMDESRVRQVLINLVGNGLKFTHSGAVTLTVTASEEAAGTTIGIAVRDTGIGIAPDQQGRIFGAFDQQLGQSINEYGGTGMGLALTQGLVSLMNGEIAVESELGTGSEFTVSIPGVEVITRARQPLEAQEDEEETAQETELSDEAVARLPGLLARLQPQTPTVDRLRETMTINDLESFAQTIQDLGVEFAYPPLEAWAHALAEQVSRFDLDAVADSLQAFPDLEERIQERIDLN